MQTISLTLWISDHCLSVQYRYFLSISYFGIFTVLIFIYVELSCKFP